MLNRQSRMETNRKGFNFLITSRGYHSYSILHRSMRSPASLNLPVCLSMSVFLSHILDDCLAFRLSLSFFFTFLLFRPFSPPSFSNLFGFFPIVKEGRRSSLHPVLSPRCCVTIETRGWRCVYVLFFVVSEAERE